MFRILLTMAVLCLGFAAPLKAQETKAPPLLMLQQLNPTHPERIVLTFHKIANVEPDFTDWARNSPFLKDAKRIDHPTIVSREDNRLRRLWAEMDPKAPIIVHTRIQLDEYSTLQGILKLSEFTPRTFFSYSMYGENVAIVPKDIAGFGTVPVDNAQMEDMLKKTGGGQAIAEIILSPAVADAKEPFRQGGEKFWLLLAEIGEIRFWSLGDNPQLLWMHRADWYKPEEDAKLLNLKEGK